MIALDTDTCVDLIRREPIALAALAARNPNEIRLPTIVVAELRYGALKSGRPNTISVTEAFLSTFGKLPFDERGAELHAHLRSALASHPIGPNDLLVAATALAHNCTLVTGNRREFTRVPSLRIETWR